MEKTLLGKRKLVRFLRLEDISSIVCAVLIGLASQSYMVCIIFPYLSYVYMRKQRECIFSMIAIIVCTMFADITLSYLYAIGFTCFFLFIQILRLWDKNVYKYIPWIAAFSIIPYALRGYGMTTESLLVVMTGLILSYEVHKDYHWIKSNFKIHPAIYAGMIFSIMVIANHLTNAMYSIPIFSGGFLLIACIADLKSMIALGVVTYLLVPVQVFVWIYPVVLFILNLYKKDKIICLLLLAALYVTSLSAYEGIYIAMAMVLGLIYQDQLVPFLEKGEEVLVEDPISPKSMLRRQMNNFSSIFASLASYYENVSGIGSDMLFNMASALKYSADEIKKISGKENVRERILQALEGYQYEVNYFMMEEIGEGNIHMEFDIKNIKKTEIKTTLLPLLEVLLRTRLRISNIKHLRFTSGYHHIVIETYVPFQIEAIGNGIKNPFEESGDTFSIFHFRQSVVCMLSDGMGVGERAATSSRLITNIFQRMIVSGISQVESIKCINKLLQSDSYATLDVICFDQSDGVAYISKSAACPTYLIRDKQLYEISGSSLPVGIVSSVEPDCYSIDIKNDDEFLMVSDGVYEDEISAWLQIREQKKLKEDVDTFLKVLKKNRRKDDSTILLAKVKGV